MEWSEFLNTDTVQLTVIPGILVLLVLVFWFKRSGKKHSKLNREFGRAPNSRHDNLDWSTAVTEADQEVRLGQAYDLDVLGDEVVSVNASGAKGRDEIDHVISDGDEPFTSMSKRSNQHADDIDFLDEVESIYSRVDDTELVEKASFLSQSANKTSDNIVYTCEDEIPELADSTRGMQGSAEPELQPETERVEKAKADQSEQDGLILVLNVVASGGRQFRGSAMLKALTATGLTFGAMNIFHYLHPSRPGTSLFSVANMVEPGCFTLTTMEELTSPGLTLFANVDRPEECINTFTVMLETAKKLAEILGGEVCDERRGTLSKQGVEHIHSQIREHQRRSRLAHAART